MALPRLTEGAMRPSAFDSRANFAWHIDPADVAEWCIVLSRTRDSDELAESNFACAHAAIRAIDADHVDIHRFGHWACGWIEYLCVRAGTAAYTEGERIAQKLDDYPVLNEDDWSEREQKTADTIWRDCYTWRERVKYIHKYRSQFDFRDWRELRAVVRGDYFIGYASELIN